MYMNNRWWVIFIWSDILREAFSPVNLLTFLSLLTQFKFWELHKAFILRAMVNQHLLWYLSPFGVRLLHGHIKAQIYIYMCVCVCVNFELRDLILV
jgi:hypothetical protein